ncbi:hypothetical protein [Streptomyces syringium]|uniref:Uncharacterized protein n=1 Tax=Streptomyces syringium TaxID=76729 RepID=A0ABS4XWE7_9ACTN|nr:hypothetical protein [Streptomyces syringium]MBP2400710.1 hypothetical protein [Streptomyces syringium]
MGVLKNSEYTDLAALRDEQERRQHGWATDACGIDLKAVDRLQKDGLSEMADAHTLHQLRPGPPQWAARLTPEGHDTLVYLPARRSATPSPRPPHAVPETAGECASKYKPTSRRS